MNVLHEKLIHRVDAPSIVPAAMVAEIASYREAVCACWRYRRDEHRTHVTLAEMTGMKPSHLSHYLNPNSCDKSGRPLREMPAKYLTDFEIAAGNTFVTQWLAMQSKLTILESMIAEAA